MKREEKELLLKDLCARLPYGVKAHTKLGTNITVEGVIDGIVKDETEDSFDISFIKPYLRPMSDMTRDEKKEFDEFCVIDEDAWKGNGIIGFTNQALIMSDAINWLNAHHIDYRQLIEQGLALEAPAGMYNF